MLAAIPVADRSARMEMALASAYDQLKDTKNAIAAYRRALALDSDNLDIKRGLASALLTDGQLVEAQKLYTEILAAEPQDAQSQIRLSETQRRQGHYDQALETLEKAKPQAPDSMELSYNEALLYDALGRYDDATALL
ncbi:MAG: tetratricopeptide repeat protein, partial [Acidobacteriaceae bacterium]|nr:tetratricopeptide repeat protein [Acidobacteriaceae bacterium]